MEIKTAINSLTALAQEGRLRVFRELVKAGSDGMAAGDIAKTIGVAPNTLSAQLTILSHAGLISRRREGRSIIYKAEFAHMGDMMIYLMEDCCQGHALVCAPLAKAAQKLTACSA